MGKKLLIQKSELFNLYVEQNKSAKEVAQILGCSTYPILKHLKLYNIPVRKSGQKIHKSNHAKYSKNKKYFSVPNIENSYWAGFIAADGCIRDGNRQSVNLEIQERDIEILEAFKTCTNFNGPIHNIIHNKKNWEHKISESKCVKLGVSNAVEWITDLQRYWNITPRKSLTLEPPNITEVEHKLAYIIGYIDGDGTIGLYKYKRRTTKDLELKILGTENLLNWIYDVLSLLENKNYKKPIHKDKNVYRLKYSGIRAYNILKILESVNLRFKLNRKWLKIHEYEQQKINLASSMG